MITKQFIEQIATVTTNAINNCGNAGVIDQDQARALVDAMAQEVSALLQAEQNKGKRIAIINDIDLIINSAYGCEDSSEEQRTLSNYIYFSVVKVINNLLDNINTYIKDVAMLDNSLIEY